MARGRIIPMPEQQFVQALEREADVLSERVDGALAAAEKGRDLLSRADELARGLRTRGAGTGRGRRRAGRKRSGR